MKKTIFLLALAAAGVACGLFLNSLPSLRRFELKLLGDRLWKTSAERHLAALAQGQPVDEEIMEEHLAILQSQFPEGEWDHALAWAGITPEVFTSWLREHQRALAWIERDIRDGLKSSPSENRQYYEANQSLFALPVRRRARHIFFAAPNGSSPGLVEEKEQAARMVVERLEQGESFEATATESEDEATKNLGGDLGFFSQNRMLPEIWNALAAQKVGGPAVLVRTHLGFHVIQLTDERLSSEISFAEAAVEIGRALENAHRLVAVDKLRRGSVGSGP